MDPAIAQRLVALNNQFYQRLAAPFSASRSSLQPGVMKVLEDVPAEAHVLDLGCGNGGVARQLAQRVYRGRYVGVDFSAELLEVARASVGAPHAAPLHFDVQFIQADLTSQFNQHSAIRDRHFDLVFAIAVLHHIPSRELRLSFLRQVHGLLSPSGRFVLSNWQFLNSPRLRARIQPWSAFDLDQAEVDAGDYLLDWRRGGSGLRYVHHFDEAELRCLAAEAGFTVAYSFLSDGKGGNLALYHVWVVEEKPTP